MNEKEVIQSRGFRNVYSGGKAVGFQVRYRLDYYRGIWLSMSEGFNVTVDGEKFSRDQIKLTLEGHTYTMDEAAKRSDVHWSNQVPITLTIDKPGGLSLGLHNLEISEYHRVSYTPYPPPGGAAPGSFGGPRVEKRQLVLVR